MMAKFSTTFFPLFAPSLSLSLSLFAVLSFLCAVLPPAVSKKKEKIMFVDVMGIFLTAILHFDLLLSLKKRKKARLSFATVAATEQTVFFTMFLAHLKFKLKKNNILQN